MNNPKLFISYSWSTPEHEAWVVQFATELVESGVDVVLDKWDLKEGNDANSFMEQMVSDPEIKKVVLICDRVYAEKADNRKGGTGTEAQIISKEIYQKQKQDKFVAIVREKDDSGTAYLPIYYKSRIYIDLNEPETYSQNFEQLLRWIYDKPLFTKPTIGKVPTFIEESTSLDFSTSGIHRRLVDAIKNQKNYSEGLLADYFNVIVENFETLRIVYDKDDFDDKVIENIESFLPFRNEIIEIFSLIARYRDNDEIRIILHRFFEDLIPFLFHPNSTSSYRDWDFDNYRFIIHELFLYLVGILIRYEKFESAAYLMRNQYYIHQNTEYGREPMVRFRTLRQYTKSLEYRNKRLKTRRLSIRADLLSKRCTNLQIQFRHIMQADFVLFIRDHLESSADEYHWYPETLLYADRFSSAFEVFSRSQSKIYFDKSKKLFDIDSVDVLKELMQLFQDERKMLIPRWEIETFNPLSLSGIDKIATKP